MSPQYPRTQTLLFIFHQFSFNNFLFLQPCEAGYYGGGGTDCLPCPTGHYSDTSGASSCTPCPSGYQCPSKSHWEFLDICKFFAALKLMIS